MERMTINQVLLAKYARQTADRISRDLNPGGVVRVFGVPRGGVAAALAVGQYLTINMVDDPAQAQVIVDDLIDSGATEATWRQQYPGTPFYALIDKRTEVAGSPWIIFPWEGNELGSFEDNITRLLQFVGEKPERGGLKETPARVVKAWKHWCGGYAMDAKELLKVFEDGGERYDQMVTVKDIPFYSHCEHHLAMIIGTASVSYIPNGKIVGLSKLSRLVDMYARRLQVQERMTDQIADALEQNLKPKGVGVLVRARHMCMESRGVCQQGHHTITTALRGVIARQPDAKAEFLRLAE